MSPHWDHGLRCEEMKQMVTHEDVILKKLLLEHGVLHVLEKMSDLADDIAREQINPALSQRWKTAAGSLRYAVRSIEF